ncbi:MAG: hypothetical protein C5B59_19890 [Bacteroidetes bacterium]|nr:MAG: hypothetical protein C5B59_19890 [Bacteroidota bacterium]
MRGAREQERRNRAESDELTAISSHFVLTALNFRIFVYNMFMKKLMQIGIALLISLAFAQISYSQKTDTAKQSAPKIYFIITAGDQINAFFNDKPVEASTIDDFNTYVQTNIKSLKDSWVIVTGKPKTGTYDDVMKTLKRYKFKHISTNLKDL